MGIQSKSTQDLGLGKKLLSAGTAACIADCITFPLDTAKVRLMLQGEGTVNASLSGALLKYRGVTGTIRVVVREEGARALYNGLVAGLQRQMCFASIRIGGYDLVKSKYKLLFYKDSNRKDTFFVRVLSGLTTGSMCVCVAQPTDVVKIRMQGQKVIYKGCIDAYTSIFRQEGGLKGLWKGTLPNICRNAIVNVAELVTYDIIKENILATNVLTDNVPCHFLSAFGAGFCATVMASPVDVIKTRYMNSRAGEYRGALDCAVQMYREKGVFTFYKGFVPSFTRLGSWSIAMFVFYEQIKRLMVRYEKTSSVWGSVVHCTTEEKEKIPRDSVLTPKRNGVLTSQRNNVSKTVT